MRNWMIALGLVIAIGAGLAAKEAYAYSCTTTCFGYTCTTNCF